MKKIYFLSTLILAISLFLTSKASALAADGTFNLRSTNQYPYRCYVSSLQMQNLVYNVAVSCRDIIYPADQNIFSYILWANPADGSKPVKLGALNLGRAVFNVKTDFTSLFVTTEQNPNVRDPSGAVVMKGSIEPITFLEKPGTPIPTLAPGEEPSEATPTAKPSVSQRLLTGLKRAGLASALALVAILALVFVLTRPRG